MKSLWNITLKLGDLIVPVKVFGATKKSHPEFEMVDSRDLSKIKFIKCNASTGEIVPNEFIGKAYNEQGQLIPVTEDLLKSCLPDKNNQLSFDQFFNTSELPLIFHENFYVLVPDPVAEDSSMIYVFLRDELYHSGLSGLTNGVFRNQNCLFALSSNSKYLILHKLRYNEQIELPELPELPKAVQFNGELLDRYSNHVHAHVISFNDHHFRDELSGEIMELIRHKKELMGSS